MKTHRSNRRVFSALVLLATCVAAFGVTRVAMAATQFCAPNTSIYPNPDGGVPLSGPSFPQDPQSDPGWLNAYRFSYGYGTPIAAAVQMETSPPGTPQYLDVEVDLPDDDGCVGTDGFIIAFDNGASASPRYREVFVQMTDTCPSPEVAPAANVSYVDGSGPPTAGGWGTVKPAPPGLSAYVGSSALPSGNFRWWIELQIPIGAFGLSTTGGTNVFWAISDGTAAGINDYAVYTWPTQCGLAASTPWPTDPNACILNFAPNAALSLGLSNWAPLAFNSSCGGVSITGGNISVTYPDTTQHKGNNITLNQPPNYLHAFATNNGPTASGVTAKFQIGNFGTSFAWADVGTSPAATVTDAGADLAYGPWTITDASFYTDPSNPYGEGHECILVKLDSTSAVTQFTNQSAYTNMHVGNTSGYQDPAFVSTVGLGPPPAGSTNFKFLYRAIRNLQYAYGDGANRGLAVGEVGAEQHWLFQSYLDSGKQGAVQGKPAELLYVAPAFGYVIDHDMGGGFTTDFTTRHQTLINSLQCHTGMSTPIPFFQGPSETDPTTGATFFTDDSSLHFGDGDLTAATVCWAVGTPQVACGAPGSGTNGGTTGCTEALSPCCTDALSQCGGQRCQLSSPLSQCCSQETQCCSQHSNLISTRGPTLTGQTAFTMVSCDASGSGKSPSTPFSGNPPLQVGTPTISIAPTGATGGQVSVGSIVTLSTRTSHAVFRYTTDGTMPGCIGSGTWRVLNGQAGQAPGSTATFTLNGTEKQINVVGCRSSGVNGAPTPGDFNASRVTSGSPLSFIPIIELRRAVAARKPAAKADAGAPPALAVAAKAMIAMPLQARAAAATSPASSCFSPPDPRFYDAVNARLATDSEMPAATDVPSRLDGFVAIAGTKDWYEVDVPQESTVKVYVNTAYGATTALPAPGAGAGQTVPTVGPCNCSIVGGRRDLDVTGAALGCCACGATFFLRRRGRKKNARARREEA